MAAGVSSNSSSSAVAVVIAAAVAVAVAVATARASASFQIASQHMCPTSSKTFGQNERQSQESWRPGEVVSQNSPLDALEEFYQFMTDNVLSEDCIPRGLPSIDEFAKPQLFAVNEGVFSMSSKPKYSPTFRLSVFGCLRTIAATSTLGVSENLDRDGSHGEKNVKVPACILETLET